MKNTGRRTEFALGWEGQIFVKQAGWRTVVLHVTSEDTVGSLKARFRWSNSRLIKSPRELWDDTRSLGSYGVRKEDTLMLCGRLWGGGVCMGKPTVVAPGEDIAPQDASPAVEAPAAPTAPEEVASPAEDEAPRQKAEEEETAAQKAADVSVPASAPSPANAAAKKAAEEPPAAEAPAAPAAEEKAPEAVTAAEAPAPAAGARQARATGVVATENEVAQRHAKLCMDVSGLIRKGKFGGIALFDSTLEEQVGYMDATALRGMYAEHVMDAASSAAPFSPPNNPSLTCTPEGEFWYVVGKDGIDITKWEVKPGALPAKYEGCMVEGRNATPLSELLEADEAKRAKLRDTELIALRLYSGKKSFSGRRYGCPVVSILLHLPYF